MNKIALGVGSFIVGACCGSMALSLIHTSTRVQAGQTMLETGAEPVVPPLRIALHGGGIRGGGIQPLDGIDCDGCVLAAGRFTYAGGAFRFTNAQLGSNIPIELKGAALNTLNLLRAVGALPNPQQPIPPPKTPPRNKKNELELKAQSNFTLVSLEGVQK